MSLQNFLEIVPVIFAAGESKLFHLSGAYFEIIDAPNPVDVVLTDRNGVPRGVMKNAEASFFIKSTDYDTIQLTSATAQTIRFAFGTSEAGTRRSTGSVTISGSVALDAPTLAALESIDLNTASLDVLRRPLAATAAFSNNAAVTINTPIQVFAPGANTNGAVILSADISWSDAANSPTQVFISKTSSPANITDGDVYVASQCNISISGNYVGAGRLSVPQLIPAGHGLYFISNNTMGTSALNARFCRYRLL